MQLNSMPSQFLRLKQVKELTGLSRSTIYAEIKAGRFPKQIRITTKRCSGWINAEIIAHNQARIDASRNSAKGGV